LTIESQKQVVVICSDGEVKLKGKEAQRKRSYVVPEPMAL
jgi:hypothetical protein